jgi:glycerol-3-phosphate O-acyltransferase/dihydroxyacetone phosphate acyltransferase
LEKYGVNPIIVPVGLNYFRGHRFRGRVVVEYGTPLKITEDMFKLYKESKKKGYQALLTQV